MADPGLIKRMVDDGWGREAAIESVDALTAVIREQLIAGKSVALAGVGTLKAPEAVAAVKSLPGKVRMQRKVGLRSPAVVEAGEPYDDTRKPVKRRYYGNGVMA